MVRESICLYDSDPLYGRMIMQALKEEGAIPGNYACFSDMAEFCSHVTQSKVMLVMLEAEKEEEFFAFLQENMTEEQIVTIQERLLLLTEVDEHAPGYLYKYLSRTAMTNYLKGWWEAHKPACAPKPVKLAPKVTGQHMLGYVAFDSNDVEAFLATNKANGMLSGALVVHMELLPYQISHAKPVKNLSDLIYQISIHRLPQIDCSEFTYMIDGITYMEPLAHYKDSYEMNDKLARELMEYLRSLSYRNILLITDCHFRGASTMLELCDSVQMGTSNSPINRHRAALFLQMVELEQREDLLRKLKPQNREAVYG